MGIAADLEVEVKRIFREQWTVTKATVVPDAKGVALEKNAAKEIDWGTVLYADLSGSTTMVNTKQREFAAEVYRTFLYSAAQIIKAESGVVTAYDGDRIMAVFLGSSPNSNAARSALKINHAVIKIINPAIKSQYGDIYAVRHVVGIDRSPLFVARTGVRGDNDLVWVGRAANFAAKLTEISNDAATFITGEVFDCLNESAKFGGSNNELMWTEKKWSQMNNMRIYSSSWSWTP